MTEIPAPVTAESLKQADIALIGNAWNSFSDDEVHVLSNFVENGGSLLLLGLGWSFEDYNPKKGINAYPMNQIGKGFGIRWNTEVIPALGSEDQFYMVFKNFYR